MSDWLLCDFSQNFISEAQGNDTPDLVYHFSSEAQDNDILELIHHFGFAFLQQDSKKYSVTRQGFCTLLFN
jgi:hypothetical protein